MGPAGYVQGGRRLLLSLRLCFRRHLGPDVLDLYLGNIPFKNPCQSRVPCDGVQLGL